MKSKRGLSPLIATGLLIVLAIGLGIIVMNFGRAQIEVAAQCAVDIGLQFTELNAKQQVCLDRVKGQLFFIVENGQQIQVESMHLRAIGEEDVLSQTVDESKIEKLGTILKYVPYDIEELGTVRQIRLTPTISLYNEEITCSEQALIVENVRDCEQ
jgi:hypothetical protein